MNKSVVIFGPQGCGKTRNQARLAKHFGLRHCLDWTPGEPVPVVNHLLLTIEDPRQLEAAPGHTLTREKLDAKKLRRVYSFAEAMRLAGAAA